MSETSSLNVIHPSSLNFKEEGMVYLDGVVYGETPEQPLLMDIFYKKDAVKPMPVVIWIHGGAWCVPELTRKYRPELELGELARRGFLIASIDYRLSQQAVFPAQIEDCKCAVRYLRAHAEEYGLDAAQIGVWGESAGGHLAGLLGATAHVKEFEGNGGWQDQSSAVQAVCVWYASNNMLRSAELKSKNNESSVYDQLFGGSFEQKKDLIWAASPIKYANLPMPPFLLMHGDVDTLVPYWQSRDYYDALSSAGNDVELVTVPGQGHGFFKGEEYYEKIYSFFEEKLIIKAIPHN